MSKSKYNLPKINDDDPKLVDSKIYKKVRKIVEKTNVPTWSDKMKEFFLNIYKNYIKPNMWFVIFLILLMIFLYYRYRYAQNQKLKEKKKNKKRKRLQKEQEYYQELINMYYSQQDEIRKLYKEMKYNNQMSLSHSYTKKSPYSKDYFKNPKYLNREKTRDKNSRVMNPSDNEAATSIGNTMVAAYHGGSKKINDQPNPSDFY